MAVQWEDTGRVGADARRRRRRRAAAALAAVVSALTLSACSGSSSGTAPAPSGPATTVAAATAGSGCGPATAAGSTTIRTTVGGHIRTVIVHVPAGYAGTAKVPLVLNLHGSGSTALAQEGFTGMDTTADADGFIVAYPQALIPSGSGYDWNVPGQPLVGGAAVPAGAPDDVAFLTGLVHTLAARYCVDPARVYVTGFSGGARLTSQLACDASSTFAAVAPVSGVRFPSPCPTTRPVPRRPSTARLTRSIPTAATARPTGRTRCRRRWTTGPSTTAAPPPRTRRSRRRGPSSPCTRGARRGADVALYTLVGEGHEWPGGPRMPRSLTRVLGPQSGAVDADTVMWSFFAAHPMP